MGGLAWRWYYTGRQRLEDNPPREMGDGYVIVARSGLRVR